MGNSYTRQSAAQIVTGNIVEAAPINSEFNTLQNAFDGSNGHAHDGTIGNGPKISLTNSIVGVLPVTNGGIGGINKLNATGAPTVSDDSADGYSVGSIWIDTTGDFLYVCVDNTPGAAIWKTFQEYDNGLQSISNLTTSADKMIYTTASDVYATTTLTPYVRTVLDDADASTVLSTLGFSTYGKTLIDDINSSQALSTLGVSNYAKTILDDADATTALSTLGFSAYGKTLIDDTDASTALSTLGFSAYGKTLIDDADASTALSTLGFSAFGKTLIDDADATALRTTIGLNNVNNTSDAAKPISTATQTALDLKASLIGTETLTNKTLTTPVIILKQSSTPAPTAEGDIQWDTDDNYLVIGDGTAQKIFKPSAWEVIYNNVVSGVFALATTNLSAYRDLKVSFDLNPDTVDAEFICQLSTDNGSTWIGGTNYFYQNIFSQTTSVTSTGGTSAYIPLTGFTSIFAGPNHGRALGHFNLTNFNKTNWCGYNFTGGFQTNGTNLTTMQSYGGLINTTARDGIRISSSQAFSGRIIIEGIKG